jgi:hypothetical protein
MARLLFDLRRPGRLSFPGNLAPRPARMHDMRFHPETACPDVGAADRFAVVARRTHVGAGARRTIERQAADRGQKLVSSHYWPDVPPGDLVDGVRCEDIERPIFRDGSFDLVVSSDVFEHISSRRWYGSGAAAARRWRTAGPSVSRARTLGRGRRWTSRGRGARAVPSTCPQTASRPLLFVVRSSAARA